MLFTPITINKTEFRNRIIFPSMVTRFAGSGGEMSDQLIRYHVARARGGAALNILEATCVHPSGVCFAPGVDIFADRHIRGVSRFTSALHAAGGRAGVQLNHGGLYALPGVSGQPVPIVSFAPGMTPNENSRVLDGEDIRELVQAYGQAARRAVEAGFDLVEIHGAHGYLIAQFLSPLTNRREDDYGGSFERRLRFPLDVVRAVREAVGPDFPVSFRCSVEEFLPGGITLDLGCRIAEAVCAAGVDLFNVSSGTCANTWYIEAPAALPEAFNADRAEAVRRFAGAVPLAVAARIGTREAAESVLSSGKADMVCMGRALIADPDLPVKLAAGRDASVRPCIYCCEGCCKQPLLTCALNPAVGRERLDEPRNGGGKASAPKKAAVVGAGPAGMEFALEAALRGHDVTLYEERERLGGELHAASLPPRKSILSRVTEWFGHELAAAGVNVVLGRAVTAAMLKDLGVDIVFVATGGHGALPEFAAKNGEALLARGLLRFAEDILEGASFGGRVLLVGGGLVGCETAAFLAERGARVTITKRRPVLAPDMEKHGRFFLMRDLERLGVTPLLETEVKEVREDGSVLVRDRYGRVRELPPFDTVVLAAGHAPRTDLCADLLALGVPFVAAGDCVKPGKILDAVHDAFKAARAL